MRRAQASRLARLRAHLVGATAGTEPGFAEKFSAEYMEELAREAAARTEGSGSLEERVAVQWFGQKTPPGDGAGVARFSQRIRDLGLEGHIDELDEVGFTVIPPATLGLAPGLIERMRDGALRMETTGLGNRGGVPIEALDDYAVEWSELRQACQSRGGRHAILWASGEPMKEKRCCTLFGALTAKWFEFAPKGEIA